MYRSDDEKHFTRLTLEMPDKKITYDLPYMDVSGEDMVHGLATIMLGMTFGWDTILASLAGYVSEHGYDEYDVRRKDEYGSDYTEPKEQTDDEV